jgi:NRPS condensation-like uncharacterized protein
MASERKSALSRPAWANRNYRVEAFDLWHYGSGHLYTPFIRTQVDFDGHLDEAILAEALEQSCVTFPLIACRFDTTPLIRPRWVPRADAAHEILQVIEIPKGECREDVVQRALAIVPDLKEGPQLRLILVRDSERDSLCQIVNHMLCDGMGAQQYFGEVARLYSRIAEGLDPSPAPFVRQRGIGPVMRGFGLHVRLFTPARMGFPTTEVSKEHLYATGFAFESGPLSLLSVSLPAEDFKHIRVAAKALGFTVNDLLVASLALAWYRVHGVNEFMMPCTMNMRGFAPRSAKMGITNFTVQCLLMMHLAPDDTLEDIMTRLIAPMKVYKQGLPGMSQLMACWIVTRFLPFRRMQRALKNIATTFPLCVTNAGVIDENGVRFGNAFVRSIRPSAPAPFSPSFLATASTFRDELIIALSVESDDATKDFIHTVLATAIEELKDFGGRHPS